jgi:hypothetical protein
MAIGTLAMMVKILLPLWILEIDLWLMLKFGNEEGVNFYGISCTKPLHQVSEQFTNMWGNTFELGDMIVVGTYYQKWGTRESSYVLLRNSHIVYLYSHLVRVVKFMMTFKQHCVNGIDVVLELHEDALQGIQHTIACIADAN